MAYDYSRADWGGLRDHLRDVPWEDIFKLCVSAAAASEFCEWVQIGIDVYIPHRKYQVKPHSSPWFSAVCAAAIVHGNHFFHLYQQNKSSESKVKFRQASYHCKRVLEAAKLAHATKTRVHHFPETWLSGLLANWCIFAMCKPLKVLINFYFNGNQLNTWTNLKMAPRSVQNFLLWGLM